MPNDTNVVFSHKFVSLVPKRISRHLMTKARWTRFQDADELLGASTSATVQMFSAARAPVDCTNAAKHFRRPSCDNTKQKPQRYVQRSKVSSHEGGMDVFDVLENVSRLLNAVCSGSTFKQACIALESESLGSPSSEACLRTFVNGWTRWAGSPKLIRCDAGTHLRGMFGQTLSKQGVAV